MEHFGFLTWQPRLYRLTYTSTANNISHHSLLNHLAPNFGFRELNNYGCAGIGSLNPFVGNAGALVDDIDIAINSWKICIRCAMDVFKSQTSTELPKYEYHSQDNYCSKFIFILKFYFEIDQLYFNNLANLCVANDRAPNNKLTNHVSMPFILSRLLFSIN